MAGQDERNENLNSEQREKKKGNGRCSYVKESKPVVGAAVSKTGR